MFNFKVRKVEEVSHEMLFLARQTLTLGGHSCVLHGRRDTLEANQYQHVVFLVAGAALCAGAFDNFVAGAAFCDVAKVLF